MIVTVTCPTTDAVYSLEVSPDIELENFRVLVGVECGEMNTSNMVFYHNGRLLSGDKKSLTELGVSDNDVLLFGALPRGASALGGAQQQVRPTQPRQQNNASAGNIDWSSIRLPPMGGAAPPARTVQPQPAARPPDNDNPETIRLMFLNDPHQLSLLKERNPKLAEVINAPEDFAKILEEQRQERAEQEKERIRLLAADPFDLEAQAKIAEEIRMENVNQNMQVAMEYNPAAFAEVYMLYINCKVNGHPVKAFVDSGAQMTIMSQACAQRCEVMRLIDQRWQGVAVGVGKQKIIGRVHMGQMQIEGDFLSTSFTILEHQPMDILLGLDMLKRHQCCIDLKKNSLVIGTTGTHTPFLNEAELPECARLNRKRTLPDDEAGTSGNLQEEEDRMLAQTLAESVKDAT